MAVFYVPSSLDSVGGNVGGDKDVIEEGGVLQSVRFRVQREQLKDFNLKVEARIWP